MRSIIRRALAGRANPSPLECAASSVSTALRPAEIFPVWFPVVCSGILPEKLVDFYALLIGQGLRREKTKHGGAFVNQSVRLSTWNSKFSMMMSPTLETFVIRQRMLNV